MTTPTFHEQTGINVLVFKPAIVAGVSYIPRGTNIPGNLAKTLDAYSHTIDAKGGWVSASIAFTTNQAEAEEWYANGLNRHIETHNAALERIFAGFVNVVSLAAGTLSATRGPLMDVVNRQSVSYTPILDPTTNPPIKGSQRVTPIRDDATSQGKYGILESVEDGGEQLDDGVTDEAAQKRNTLLQELKDPESGEDLDLGGAAVVNVTLEILGYVHRFKKWVMQDLTTATTTLSTKVGLVVLADPNGMFSTDLTGITNNPFLTSRYENDNRMGWDVLQRLVSVGDVGNNRYTMGIYKDLKIIYAPLPTTAAYQHRITGPDTDVHTFSGNLLVQPWDVLPARWLFLSDFLTGRSQPAALRDDPRYIFIESVTYSAPYGLSIRGNKVGTIAQLLAKKGMWG